jgi:hypothetical protein
MKKLLTLALVLVFSLSLIPSAFMSAGRQKVSAVSKNETLVHQANWFRPIGYDWDGVTKLDPPRDFPWQRPGEEVWGRPGFYIPSAVRARRDGQPIPVQEKTDNSRTYPVYYTQIYLDVVADGGTSTLKRPFYAVVDTDGQLWYDQDGYFNDSRYNSTADPIFARAPYEPFINGGYVPGSCNTNPKGLIDYSGNNNTKGPYFLNRENPFYNTKQFFWDYKKDQFSEATNRMWQIGWVDMIDYPFMGAVKGDMTVSDGIVKYDTVKKTGDWDYGLPVVPFLSNELHTDQDGNGFYTPGDMKTGRLHEFIYRASQMPYNAVKIGDLRLTPVSIQVDDEVKTYPHDTMVQAGDWDIGLDLINFHSFEKHTDNIALNAIYDPLEWIYRLPYGSETIMENSVRLTNVNGECIINAQGVFKKYGTGLSVGDALLMLEVTDNNCVEDRSYDVHVLSDVFMGQNPGFATAVLRSQNGDLVAAAQRVQKSTVLDPGLDVNRYKTLPGTTFHNVKFKYREFIGLEIFFDNGIDNMMIPKKAHDVILQLDLTDNYKEGRTGEQFIGSRNYLSTQDLSRRLTPFTENYRYNNAGGNEQNPRYGCGEAIYWLPNPAYIGRKTDINGNLVVEAGDRRFTDVELDIGGIITKYQRNTIVTEGDVDVGLSLLGFTREKIYIPNYNKITPDTSAPFEYDPIYTHIYYDTNDNGIVDFGDIRLNTMQINEVVYACGSEVSGGDVWFMESIVYMLTMGQNGHYNYMDAYVLPGDIGLKVDVNPPLMVEQTSTITVSVNPPPRQGEKVYVSIQEPQANEVNLRRQHVYNYIRDYEKAQYIITGKNMNWYGMDKAFTYELPFDFSYLGQNYRKIYVSTNGFINFSSGEPIARPLDQFDARLLVYGDALRITRPTDNISIAAAVASTFFVNGTQNQPLGIYISQTNDSITIRWRAQTQYTVPAGSAGSYLSPSGLRFGLVDAQVTLFDTGDFLLNYMTDMDVPNPLPNPPNETYKLLNRVNNITSNGYTGVNGIIAGAPLVGITDGMGFYQASPIYSGLKNIATVDGVWVPFSYIVTPRLRTLAAEKWTMNVLPFNEPHAFYPRFNEIKPFEDFAVLTAEKPTATFQFTPYRGTAREVGIPEWVEVRAYKDSGGSTIAPPDSTYTYLPEFNYADPTVWASKWERLEYWRYPWGEFQKTRWFVYPPTKNLIPRELSGTYDCFGLERLQVEPEKFEILPSRECISILDERQPIVALEIKNFDNPLDVNDPNSMAVASTRRTVVYQGLDVDFAFVNHPPTGAPNGSPYIRVQSGMVGLFRVGDYVYIETGLPTPMYRRIVAISGNDLYFDLPIHVFVPNGSQIVQNALIANYNVKGGGINGMFTTIGAAGQRYIVQVRDDGNYDFWRWYEPNVPGQVKGVLDPTDWIYSWQNPYVYDRWDSAPYVCNPNLLRTPLPTVMSRPPLSLEDMDCSIGQNINQICGDQPGFPRLGEWSFGDRYGLFGNFVDEHWNFPNFRGVPPQAYGNILTWGVPTLLSPKSYPNPTDYRNDDGGKAIIVAWPTDPSTPLNIRLYTTATLLDYNSSLPHPGHYILEPGMGIDYCSEISIKIAPANPDLNFTDVSIIDHALQNSWINYTTGTSALHPLNPPNPQIGARYFPMVKNFNNDIRSYPGGQSHAGRVRLKFFNKEHSAGSAWNAYPAIWRDKFVKLGTEFMPQTDYGLAFYLKRQNAYDHVSFYNSIRKIEVTGPFATPKKVMEDQLRGGNDPYLFRLNTRYDYNGHENVPLHYDFSGKITVDPINFGYYQIMTPSQSGINLATVTNPTAPYDFLQITGQQLNPWILNQYGGYDHKWSYYGAGRHGHTGCNTWLPNTFFLFDELIPVGHGKIDIMIEFTNGAKYHYTDCCQDPPLTSLPVHGIKIDGVPTQLEIEQDHELSLLLTEASVPEQDTRYANNAYLMVWQDRGIMDPMTRRIIGMGDGHITNPPRSSTWFEVGKQFPAHHDLNRDGKISFADYETEVMGTYDMATNTWSSGVIDGRTFMREDGEFIVNLSASNGSQLTTIGYDYGGMPDARAEFAKEPDHIISQYEIAPIYINAYKYGDDNNDRGFSPFWKEVPPNEYSHEVYLSGMAKIDPVPVNRLVINTSPDILTAGVTPELMDPENPLTFIVLDEQGDPIDLFKGVPDIKGDRQIALRNLHNLLFQDPHPDFKDIYGPDARLPQFYWVRTDLHNNDGTLYDNHSIYLSAMAPFEPIRPDFSDADQGLYRFYGFTANDAGSFMVRVYSPDRRSYGDTIVNVKIPSVRYTVSNDEDPNKTVYEIPGSPDFVLTALDQRVYTIEAQVFDALGRPLVGFAGDEDCEAVPARFTPFTTFVRNLRYRNTALTPAPYYNLLGYDRNQNGKIDLLNHERINMAGFTLISGCIWYPQVYYNTGTYMNLETGGYWIGPIIDIPGEGEYYAGWGLGAIYNSMYKGGYLFANIDKTGRPDDIKELTNADSLILDQNGKASFKLFVNDFGLVESFVGGLTGLNALSINPQFGDVAGIPNFQGDVYAPNNVWKRFRYGGKRYNEARGNCANASPYVTKWSCFQLDWDAHTDQFISIKSPGFRLLNAKDRQPLGKDLLDPRFYDLQYGIENHIIVQIFPADSRDLPIKEGGKVEMFGAKDEMHVQAYLRKGSDGATPEATVKITPTGTGSFFGYINYYLEKMGFSELDNNITLGLFSYEYFDSANGLGIEIISVGTLHPRVKTTLRLRIVEAASRGPIAEARVRIRGAGVNENTRTNAEGICEIEITPTEEGIIEINATKTGYLEGKDILFVGKDTRPLFLHVDSIPGLTNQASILIKGYTKTHSRVWINETEVNVDATGKFEQNIMLKEGQNEILVRASDDIESKEELQKVTLDTVPPVITLHDPGTLVDVTQSILRGTSSEEAKIEVNGIKAELIGLNWQLNIEVKYGKNILTIKAKDMAGNESIIEKEIYVYQRWVVEIQIGSTNVYLNGVPQQPLTVPPYIKGGRVMVPVRLVSESFGAKVDWLQGTKEIIVSMEGKIVIMRVGSTQATVNGVPVVLDAPPEIVGGTTFVPLRFITEALGFEVEWIESTRTVKIIKLV